MRSPSERRTSDTLKRAAAANDFAITRSEGMEPDEDEGLDTKDCYDYMIEGTIED